MHSLNLLVPALALLVSVAQAKVCARDNCYRQVKATQYPSRPTTSDCSNFFAATPSPIPSYASSCDSTRYASACSCIGVTSSSAPASTPTSYRFKAIYKSGGPSADVWVRVRPFYQGNVETSAYLKVQPNKYAADKFIFDSQSHFDLVQPGNIQDGSSVLGLPFSQFSYLFISYSLQTYDRTTRPLVFSIGEGNIVSVRKDNQLDGQLEPRSFGLCTLFEDGVNNYVIESTPDNVAHACYQNGTANPVIQLQAVPV